MGDESILQPHNDGGIMAAIDLDAALLARYPFEAILEDEEGSAWAIFFPDALGCMTRAETWEEIGPAAREALHSWLEGSAESGVAPPAPSYLEPRETTANSLADRQTRPVTIDPNAQELFSVRDVADYAGITPGRVRQIAGERNIGRVVGAVRLFRREDLAAFTNRRPAGRPRKSDSAAAAD
jgi:predicted RNase H-like HicB family nuclease